MDPLSLKPVAEWDFRQLTHLPPNSDSRGIHLTSAGIILSGPKAYLQLPLALPIGAYLRSKSILVCLRFVNSRESLSFGLESSDGAQSEKLFINCNRQGGHRGVWVLHRSSQPPIVTFGPSASIENEINVDIHLALVADASRPPTATFTCYRGSEQYGQPARLGDLAVFHGSDGIAFSIEQSGSGKVVYSYVRVFDRALNEDELRKSAMDLRSGSADLLDKPAADAPPVNASATESGKSSLEQTSPSPAYPERWTPQQREEAALQEVQIFTAYSTGDYKKHVRYIRNFKAACEARGVDYADAYLTGDTTAEEFARIEQAKAYLKSFWKNVRALYSICKLTADGEDFFSAEKKWFRAANNYRALFEPLSIAGWYKHGNHLTDSGHYIDQAALSEKKTRRPTNYAFFDRLMKEAGGEYVDSLTKAREYKQDIENGRITIHTISDAEADPPRGFKHVVSPGGITGASLPTGQVAANSPLPLPPGDASQSKEGAPSPSPRSVLSGQTPPSGEEDAKRRWRWEYEVFISHAGKDTKTYAHRLHDEFEKIGLRAFLDQASDGLVPGDQADPRMLRAVKEAPVGLAILSEHFPQKEWPMKELRIIVQQKTLLPIFYKVTYEEAKALLQSSPQAQGWTPEEWVRFTDQVLRTTALKNPVTSSDEAPFVQAIVFSAVRICVEVAQKVVENSSDRVWAYKFVQKVEVAARKLSQEFKSLTVEQKDKAKEWANDLKYLAKSTFGK